MKYKDLVYKITSSNKNKEPNMKKDDNDTDINIAKKSVKTKDVSLVGTIKNIIEDGYLFEGLDENVYILKKAVVEFYIKDKENG